MLKEYMYIYRHIYRIRVNKIIAKGTYKNQQNKIVI